MLCVDGVQSFVFCSPDPDRQLPTPGVIITWSFLVDILFILIKSFCCNKFRIYIGLHFNTRAIMTIPGVYCSRKQYHFLKLLLLYIEFRFCLWRTYINMARIRLTIAKLISRTYYIKHDVSVVVQLNQTKALVNKLVLIRNIYIL